VQRTLGDYAQAIAIINDLSQCRIALPARRQTVGALNQQPQLLSKREADTLASEFE
jgi:hypothetical protein